MAEEASSGNVEVATNPSMGRELRNRPGKKDEEGNFFYSEVRFSDLDQDFGFLVLLHLERVEVDKRK